jgi:twinfilin-like protein
MSHKTGIKSNNELLHFFAKCKKKSSKYRLVKVSIINEELALGCYKEIGKKDWESDFDKCISSVIEENVPCYILYRLDEINKAVDSYYWMLISWIPDTATIREKMIYASTKSTLKQEFNTGNLKEEYHSTNLDEMSLDGYKKNKVFQQASTPLTQREQEINEMRRTEVKTNIGIDSRHQTMSGLNCPVSEASQQAIRDIQRGSYNYLQFEIDLDQEEINITKAERIEVTNLASMMPTDHARFHIYLFKHYYEGDYQESFVFIYSMAANCSVKERMMYSSCKAPFLDKIYTLGINFTKKLEVDDPSEVTEENLLSELYPKKTLHRQQFAKPAPPSRAGPRRIIK